MGLDLRAKGLDRDNSLSMSYSGFMRLRIEIARAAYPKYMVDMYRNADFFTEKDAEIWDKNCNDDLDIFLFHSDCGGNLTPQECRRVYNAIKHLTLNTTDEITIERFERLKEVLQYRAKRRVYLYFT